MSCSLTSDKMWKVWRLLLFDLCRNYNLPFLALGASFVWVLPSAFQCAIHFTASYIIFWGWGCKTTDSNVYHHKWSGQYCACYYSWTQTTATPFCEAEVPTAVVVLKTTVLARCWLQLCCGIRFIGIG